MLSFPFPDGSRPFHVLCLGAHCDDIEIGCGATLLKLVDEHPSLSVTWVVFASNEIRAAEARKSVAQMLSDTVSLDLRIFEYRNGYFPYVGAEIKDCFERIKSDVDADLVFTHYGNDLHQDHRLISDLTWNTFRDHLILEYEIPKYDGGLGSPNVFVPASEVHVRDKSEILLNNFESQHDKQWFARTTFEGLMRLRGVECNADSGYAEAFYARKVVLG